MQSFLVVAIISEYTLKNVNNINMQVKVKYLLRELS
jgi:hypothetical protein